MGEAKRRGTREQRVAAARARIEELKPESVNCGACGAELRELQTLDVRNAPGIEAAFFCKCWRCGSASWTLLGHPDAVAAAAESLSRDYAGN